MTRVGRLLASFRHDPSYTIARGLGRFGFARSAVVRTRSLRHRASVRTYIEDRQRRLNSSAFTLPDLDGFISTLNTRGVADGLRLPDDAVDAINEFAAEHTVYADREPDKGFTLANRDAAERVLGKPILVAQYFNTRSECETIERLSTDPLLELIAAKFLGSTPTLVGTTLWWTFPVDATADDRFRHAHMFHRDVDDYAFVKFFFYLTPVTPGDGAHICVPGSHNRPAADGIVERFRVRRYSDSEIAERFGASHILEICGEPGIGFAENTLCIHKGTTPTKTARLLLQFEFALFDHGVMHDRRESSALSNVIPAPLDVSEQLSNTL